MRKAISLFLVAAVLCLSTTAFATVATSGVTGAKNGETSLNSTYNGTGGRTATMPGFRPGDTISFDVTGVTSGNEMTLICYKYGAESDGLTSSEVSYINQYTLSDTSQEISYTIPAGSAGIYKVVINDSSSPVANFYYKVGAASAGLLNSREGTQYLIKETGSGTYSVGFLGQVTITDSEVRLQDIGANPGFTIINSASGKTKTYAFGLGTNSGNTVADFDNFEVNGSYSYIYGLTIYNVPASDKDSFTATANAYITSAN